MWIITKDYVDDGEAVGTKSVDHDASTPLPYAFRMFDGDDNLYYEGLSDSCNSHSAFNPLDDYGMGYVGCTDIHYLEDDVWKPL